MPPLRIPIAPEWFIVPMLVLLPVAFLYLGYKLVQGGRAFAEGFGKA